MMLVYLYRSGRIYNDCIMPQLRWCGGRPQHHVSVIFLSSAISILNHMEQPYGLY